MTDMQAATGDDVYVIAARAHLGTWGELSIADEPAIKAVAKHEPFRAAVDAARAQRTAEIVDALRRRASRLYEYDADAFRDAADLIERGDIA